MTENNNRGELEPQEPPLAENEEEENSINSFLSWYDEFSNKISTFLEIPEDLQYWRRIAGVFITSTLMLLIISSCT